jgi:hypothetical protein
MAERANEMNQDAEHLRLLAIFHYVVAGLGALCSFFPLLYTTIGAIFIFAARHGTAKPGEDLPPEFLGWIFAVLGSLSVLNGNSNGDLYSNCRPISCASQTLLVRFRNGLHRMLVHSLWNNSRRVYDCCAFARIGPGIIL